jgi:bacterioferritin
MAGQRAGSAGQAVSRERLADLNEDLSREYQAIIAYVVYSQVLKGPEMLRFDLENENETIRNYRERVRLCESLGEFALAERIRQILVDEQDHQIDLATALGEDVPI